MKKIFLFVIASIFISLSSQAQCLPIPPSMNEGIYPDTLSHACAGNLYYDTTVVVFFLDTTLNVPPFGTFVIPADSVIIDSITGVPGGIITTLSSPNTAYPSGGTTPAMQCIEFAGIPILPQPTTEIKLYCTYYATAPIVGVQAFQDTLSLYLAVGQNSSTGIIDTITCDFYTSPSGFSTWYSSGNYADTIANSEGCDSIITINLTLTDIDSTVIKMGDTLIATYTADSYQWYTCDSAMTIISGAIDSFYVVTTSGYYALLLEKNGCFDTSTCINMTITGIEESYLTNFQMYPNPAKTEVFFNLEREYNLIDLKIINSLGQIVSNKQYYNTNQFKAKLNFDAGVYFIEIVCDENIHLKRKLLLLE